MFAAPNIERKDGKVWFAAVGLPVVAELFFE
jgi:hypothetical protein